MIFCSRTSLIINKAISDIDQTTLTLSDLQEGEEITDGYGFDFTEQDLKETITQTSLFSSRGANRFGFVHQSYAEFLAARYLALHKLSTNKIGSLIFFSVNDQDRMIIPQLKETAAWLFSMMPELIEETIQIDPQSVLLGDIGNLDSKYRKDLVDSLLKQFEQMKILDSDWGRYSHYQKLKHPDLASQLIPYIKDKTKHRLVRRVAIDIAEICEVNETQGVLADVALDSTDNIYIRDQAAHAISKIGDDDIRLKLKSFATEQIDDDKDDRLKGNALRALWPKHLTVTEVFDSLTPCKRENFFGSYSSFLIDFPKELRTEDLPIALKWVKNNPGIRGFTSNKFEQLPDKILLHAWAHLDQPDILKAYAEAVIPRIENDLSISPSTRDLDEKQTIPELSDQTRKNLIKSIVLKVRKPRNYMFLSSIEHHRMLFDDDLEWLLQELRLETDENRKKIWSELIRDIYRIDFADHTNLILKEISHCQQLEERFRPLFEVVLLDSKKAQESRQLFERIQKHEKQRKGNESEEKKPLNVFNRITSCIDRFNKGDSNAFWQMCLEMTLKEASVNYGDEFDPDLTNLTGWKICDTIFQERVVQAAKKYIIENDAAPNKWLGKNIYYRPATAGYKAFVLLKKLEPDFLNQISNDIWKKWAAIIIGFPEFSISGEDKTYLELIKQAYDHAPDEIINALLILIDRENEKHGCLFIIKNIVDCIDAKCQDALLHKAKDVSLKPDSFQDLLCLLIDANSQDALNFAKSFLTIPISKDGDIQKTKAAALSLLMCAEDAGWDTVWSAIQSDSDFGKEIFLSLPDGYRYLKTKSLPDRIGEEKTAEVFIWLSKHFPRKDDPKREDEGVIESRESVASFRDNLLRVLENKGTLESIQSLEYIKKELPELDIVDYYLINARTNFRRNNWKPLSPADFLSFTKSPSYRLILNRDHLTEVVLESLERLEKKLQGETPSAFSLWDQNHDTKKFMPKSEDRLSDLIKTHLSDDLKDIISLREVEIRPPKLGEGGRPGEEIDIYVTYCISSTKTIARCIIEVKGCWHEDVLNAMETQLLNRYLNDSSCDNGIYLVGWYGCDLWDEKDKRKKNKLSKIQIEGARNFFVEQAKDLTTDTKKIKAFVLNCALR